MAHSTVARWGHNHACFKPVLSPPALPWWPRGGGGVLPDRHSASFSLEFAHWRADHFASGGPRIVLDPFPPSIFRRPIRRFFERYPLVAQIIGLMFVAALAASAISLVYRAWATGTVYDKGHVLTFSANPTAFTLWVGGALLFLLLMIALFGLLAWAYRDERLSDQRFRNRPPIDEAIRRRIDER
jgi:hypothetical protein